MGRWSRPGLRRLGHAPLCGLTGSPAPDESAESTAIAESSATVSSVGALGAAAQSYPLPALSLPAPSLPAPSFAKDLAGALVSPAVNRLYVASRRRHQRDRLVEKGDLTMSSLSSIHEGTISADLPRRAARPYRGLARSPHHRFGRKRQEWHAARLRQERDAARIERTHGGSLRGDSRESPRVRRRPR